MDSNLGITHRIKQSDTFLKASMYTPDIIRFAARLPRYVKDYITDSLKMRKYYYQRVQKGKVENTHYVLPEYLKTSLEKIEDLQIADTKFLETPPTITFISNTLPRFKEGSASFRVHNILKILLRNDCKINFLYYGKRWNDYKLKKALKGKITYEYMPLHDPNWETVLTNTKSEFVWITSLWSIRYFRFITELIEKVKEKSVPFRIIVDTMDFHYKELLRKYKKTGNEYDLQMAKELFKYENSLYKMAESVVVVSDKEKKDIQNKISGVKAYGIVPNIHEIPVYTRPYRDRQHMCFVGNFETQHNEDAVRYFITDIFPHILKKNPKIEFHVIGYGSEKYRQSFLSPNIKVIGSIKHLQEALSYYKLFVCPMTYGAGVKGKIGSAVEAGIPVVTTSVGAEGLPFDDGKECFITDSPSEFAEKCNICLNDIDLWHRLSIQSRLAIAKNFSPCIISTRLGEVL